MARELPAADEITRRQRSDERPATADYAGSGPLVATVPVSVHPTTSHRRGTNKVSAMFVALPCATDDSRERVEIIRSAFRVWS